MNIRRAGAAEAEHFSEATMKRRLGYVIEEGNPIYVTFTIHNLREATLTPVLTKHLDALIEVFRFHNGFVTTFYSANGALLRCLEPVALTAVHPATLGVTQWLVSADKLKQLENWVEASEDVIIPVFKRQKRLIALDGHTRLKVAQIRGIDAIYVYEEQADDLSRAFHEAAVRQGVMGVGDIEIVDAHRYARDWEAMCDCFIDTFERKRHLRETTRVARKAIAADEQARWNEALLKNLQGLLAGHVFKTLGIFYPLSNEVDVRGLDVLYETYYPVIEERRLVFAPHVGTFQEAPFQTRVPRTSTRLEAPLDVVIVPGLLYDFEGYRLGYGKGYYDGYLSRVPTLKIGVCFERFLCENLPRSDHDIAVDFVVTEARIISTK
ncbi:MAG: 5-formyltetrahydrofolate cyclo-ligase [Acholeplasmatales bacterium]|nr:MAG: 5-formyltetrahydrofolate cyclo-ligase [Acholeplasmatales bacterium]